MAKFYPPIPEDFNGSLAEERIYELLKKLPDRIRVFHSYKWMASEHYRYTREGEADFVIYDPENGILCVEVKGGGISYKSGQWWQKDNKNERVLNTNPWSQAKNASHFIRRLLKRLSPNVSIPVYPMLWFPDVIMQGNLRFPEEVPKYAVLTKDHALNPKIALESLSNIWGKYKLDQGFHIKLEPGFSENLAKMLLPSFELIPASNLSAEENDRQYFRFTKEQFKILEFIEGENRVGIAGGAGSGKTIIAREYAKRISETGDKTLLLVYNSALRIELKSILEDTNVIVHNWHSLAMESVGREDPSKVTEIFINNLMANPESFLYKHVIIDEAQDFEQDWLEILDLVVGEGTLAAFYDPLQSIQKHSQELSNWIKNLEIRLSLNRNCRNTESIAKTSYAFLNQLPPKMLHTVKGDLPIWIESPSDGKAYWHRILDLVQKVLQDNITPEEIVLMTFLPLERSPLNAMKYIQCGNRKIDFSEKREKGKILKTTIRKFKGLEAQVVIILDLIFSNEKQNQEELNQKLKQLYTASSRARTFLYLISLPLPSEIYWQSDNPILAQEFRDWFRTKYGLN